jgi:3-dehydroquinate dehydratase/shikimate dehydrogenase
MICVVIGRTRHKMVQIEIQEAAKRGAQMIELRLDFLAKAPEYQRLLDKKPCPMVVSVRRPQDGGRWSGSEDARRMMLRQAVVAGFDWVDLETDVAQEIRRYKDVKRIVSYHNMKEVPANLEAIHEQMCGQDPDVVKIAVRAQHATDNLRVLDLLKKPAKPTLAFCIGDIGFPSRILGAKYGVPFTYAAFNAERGIAPGLPSFQDLKNIYHFDQINADTAVYGVIGDPVAHSLSPLIHNSTFRHMGFNAVYIPFRVPRADLANFVKGFDQLPVRGYSVTLPHKEAAVALATHKDTPVELTQAANTLIREGEGFAAYNTDYQSAADSLLAHLPPLPDGQPATISSRSVLILGAGGAARAVAHAMHRNGAVVTIANRTPERAHTLAADVGCRTVDWAARHNLIVDVIINCTSVGMHPNVDESPIHQSMLKPGVLVMDAVYTPEQTLLIKEAKARGCIVLTGVDMFVRQAALQFKLFTSKEAPFMEMFAVVKKALSPITLREGT